MLEPPIDPIEGGRTVSVTLVTKLIFFSSTANSISWFETVRLWRKKPF